LRAEAEASSSNGLDIHWAPRCDEALSLGDRHTKAFWKKNVDRLADEFFTPKNEHAPDFGIGETMRPALSAMIMPLGLASTDGFNFCPRISIFLTRLSYARAIYTGMARASSRSEKTGLIL
jgi:hypothetical protein